MNSTYFKKGQFSSGVGIDLMMAGMDLMSKEGPGIKLDLQKNLIWLDLKVKVEEVSGTVQTFKKEGRNGFQLIVMNRDQWVQIKEGQDLLYLSFDSVKEEWLVSPDKPISMPVAGVPEKVVDWLTRGEVGSSSKALCMRLLGLDIQKEENRPLEYCYPRDAADFNRCLKMIKWTEAEDHMNRLLSSKESISPEWDVLFSKWFEMEKALTHEKDGFDQVSKIMEDLFQSVKAQNKRKM